MDETHSIEPAQRQTAATLARPARPVCELLLCIAGSILSVQLAGLGTFAMVYGAWLLFRPEEQRGTWALAGCLAPGLALSLVSFVDYGSLVLPCALCALVIARLLPGRVTVTNVCVVIAVLAAAMLGADALFASTVGMGLTEYSSALLDQAYEITVSSLQQGSSTVAAQASVEGVYEVMRKVWPLGYIAQAVIVVMLGLLGLAMARKIAFQRVNSSFMRFDVPLWGVVGLIVGLMCMLLAGVSEQGTQLEAVGLMLLLVVRVLFFLQGLSVALWLMSRRGFGFFARVLILSALLLAELSFFALCVLGIVDVWANLRKLSRKDGVANGVARGL